MAEIQGDKHEGAELREEGRSVSEEILGCSNQLLRKNQSLENIPTKANKSNKQVGILCYVEH